MSQEDKENTAPPSQKGGNNMRCISCKRALYEPNASTPLNIESLKYPMKFNRGLKMALTTLWMGPKKPCYTLFCKCCHERL